MLFILVWMLSGAPTTMVLPSRNPIPLRTHSCEDREQELPHFPPRWNQAYTCEDGIWFADEMSRREVRTIKARLKYREAKIPESAQSLGCANPELQISTERRLHEGGYISLGTSYSVGILTSVCGVSWMRMQGYSHCTGKPVGDPYPTQAEADSSCAKRY